ncbi:hypothetical protein FOA52_013538 [Chlamydomonas sp. UWO 241]|nr:hypothetical protein FOA52_013538 [Chlamydomonas sp. UWO 241]
MSKPAIATFINARPDALDFRFHLLGQYHLDRSASSSNSSGVSSSISSGGSSSSAGSSGSSSSSSSVDGAAHATSAASGLPPPAMASGGRGSGADDDARAVWKLADSLRWDAARQELVWPPDAGRRFVADVVRVKHKSVFEGLVGGYTMRLTLTGLSDADGHRTEVGGGCVELQELLNDALAKGGSGSGSAADAEAALGPPLAALATFLDELVGS